MRVVFATPGFESLGLEYVSASLRRQGVETSLVFDPWLFDEPYSRVPWLARRLGYAAALPGRVAERRPDLVAFSVMASNYAWALQAARGIKERCPGVPVVFGGLHATAVPEVVLERPQVDYCVLGEGDEAMAELCLALRDGKDPRAVRNLAYREGGAVVRTPLRPLIQDLDALPYPDKELFYREVPFFARHYTLITRRGCMARCSYCHNSMAARLYPGDAGRVRLRSVDNVIGELAAALARYDFERVRINDDIFSYDASWLTAFCRRYRREIGRPFMCSCSPVHLTEEVVRELKAAGCFQVCLGVQAVQEDVRRDHYRRYTPQASVVQALERLRRHRLRATVDNILGWPGHRLEHMEQMARFYLDNPVYGRYTVYWLLDFAGTEITARAVEQGLLSEAEALALARDPPAESATRAGDHLEDALIRRMHLALLLIQMLPRPLGRALVAHRRYRHLPAVSPDRVEAAWTAVSPDRLDPVRQRYWSRYWHFGLRALRRGGRG